MNNQEQEIIQETVQIDGVVYIVELANSPDSCEAKGLKNLAAHMREYNQARQLYLRRPKGGKTYFAVQGVHGGYSSVTKLGI